MIKKTKKTREFIRAGAIIVLFLIIASINFLENDSQGDSQNLAIYLEEGYFKLIEVELEAFKTELDFEPEIEYQVVSGAEIPGLLREHPEAMAILPRKLTKMEQSNIGPEQLPLDQQLLATGMVGSPVKALYLVQDQKVTKLEKKFDHFLFSGRGQDILFMEGYVSARMRVSQN